MCRCGVCGCVCLFRTLVNNFCMPILPFVEVCALCEGVYVLTANSALWLKTKRGK